MNAVSSEDYPLLLALHATPGMPTKAEEFSSLAHFGHRVGRSDTATEREHLAYQAAVTFVLDRITADWRRRMGTGAGDEQGSPAWAPHEPNGQAMVLEWVN